MKDGHSVEILVDMTLQGNYNTSPSIGLGKGISSGTTECYYNSKLYFTKVREN